MTTTELTRPVHPAPVPAVDDTTDPTEGYDFYREIHKGIRLSMFELVLAAGRLDVGNGDEVDRVVGANDALFDLLDLHHHHEHEFVQPLVALHAAPLATIVESQHGDVDDGIAHLRTLTGRLATAGSSRRSVAAHRLYLDLTELTSLYLAHQLVEENLVMPALRAAVPTEELLALDMAIRSSIPPEKMAGSLGFMLRAMNVDERCDMAGGMSMAPPEVFAGFRALAVETLTADEWAQVTARLGLD